MGEINHDFWDEIFKRQKNIDQDTLLYLIKEVEDMKKDLSVMQQEFEEIYNINFQTGINQEKSKEGMSKEIQCNTTCTSTATQRNTENDGKSQNVKSSEQLKEEITKELEIIDLTKQRMTDNTPSEIDEKSELMRNDKHLQFILIMHQDEIRKVNSQISKNQSRFRSLRYEVQVSMQIEHFMHKINLTSKFLEFEDEVLKLKFERERMTTEEKMVGVDQSVMMTNMSCKIDPEKSKLMIDNKYLWFVEKIHQKDINKIFVQLQMYCDNYNIPNEEENIATHRDFIMKRIKLIKHVSKLKVIDFNLQIEGEATNMETKDTETSNMSSKEDNVKSTLMKNNKYLRYITMKHQEEINRVYTELQVFCDKYHLAIENVKLAMHPSVGADVEKINMPSEIDERNELRSNMEHLRSIRAIYLKEFIKIHDQLEIYSNRYDMPSENVTIVMHTIPYDLMKTHDEENELKRDNEYLAFVAMMHLEKIKEICASFGMYRQQRFIDGIKNVTKNDYFMKQKVYVTNEISSLKNVISQLWDELTWIKTREQ